MEYHEVQVRLQRLRHELHEISTANRVYFRGWNRRPDAKKEYEERQITALEIRNELASLVNAINCA